MLKKILSLILIITASSTALSAVVEREAYTFTNNVTLGIATATTLNATTINSTIMTSSLVRASTVTVNSTTINSTGITVGAGSGISIGGTLRSDWPNVGYLSNIALGFSVELGRSQTNRTHAITNRLAAANDIEIEGSTTALAPWKVYPGDVSSPHWVPSGNFASSMNATNGIFTVPTNGGGWWIFNANVTFTDGTTANTSDEGPQTLAITFNSQDNYNSKIVANDVSTYGGLSYSRIAYVTNRTRVSVAIATDKSAGGADITVNSAEFSGIYLGLQPW